MEPLKNLTEKVTVLPRGGYLVDSIAGYIQFGAPPETIKDTMMLPKGVPTIFVLPNEFFNWIKGISVAELEFPIYYNYFIRKKKTTIICNAEQAHTFKQVIEESLFGPENLDMKNEFSETYPKDFYENIYREIDHFKIMDFDDVVEFFTCDDTTCIIDNVKIIQDSYSNFELYEKDTLIAQIPGKIEYKPKYLIGKRLSEPFIPPLFGITCLGPSSGFDPYENTSGFIIWLNHHGIMVDPPVNSTEWLLDSNVNPKFIDSLILTHCHADHDAGAFQKILEEYKITLYSTETILLGFLRKYSALTDVSIDYLKSLFNFKKITVGNPIFIHGARFDMFYTLHSIPTIGFKVLFQDKSLTYSSDHNNDPYLHDQLLESKVIDQNRYDELKNFPWESTVIVHESGVPPLHTPMSILNSLPEEIQKKTVVYHSPKNNLPKNTHLVMAEFGIENTAYFNVKKPEFEKTYQILSLLKYLDFPNFMTLSTVQEFVSLAELEEFKKGDVIIKSGTPGDKFFIIYTGIVSIKSKDGKLSKMFSVYDYFGETALLQEDTRTADVLAETDVIVYTMKKDKFHSFISGTEYEKVLHRLIEIRDIQAWELLSTSTFVQYFTSSQRAWLESILNPIEIEGSSDIIIENKILDKMYIIRQGQIVVTKENESAAILQDGDIIGLASELFEDKPSSYTFSHQSSIKLFSIDKESMKQFLSKNPGLIMKLDYVFKQYLF